MADIEVILLADGVLAGRVIDRSGRPVASAEVVIQALKGVWIETIATDGQGRFLEANPPVGRVRIEARMPRFWNGRGEIGRNRFSESE